MIAAFVDGRRIFMENTVGVGLIARPAECRLTSPDLVAPAVIENGSFGAFQTEWNGTPYYWTTSRYTELDATTATAATLNLGTLGLGTTLTEGEKTGWNYRGRIFPSGTFHTLKVDAAATVRGTAQGDALFSARDNWGIAMGAVTFLGLGGDDHLAGSTVSDRLDGGAGADLLLTRWNGNGITSGRGASVSNDRDKLLGGAGNDVLIAVDGKGDDVANCGAGRKDVAYIDRGDRTLGCERVVRDEWNRRSDTWRYSSPARKAWVKARS